MKTFLFYDVETSGLNPAFDQVLTFACIRTDFSLTEISRELITIQLRRDIIPSPHAFITHCLTIDELKHGITEYQAAQQIHEIFNTPGTISFGYNSLGFDDEFLRFLFYRNLLDPYTHQYANQCSRMDMLPVTALFRVFCDHVMKWPHLEDGRSSLKLELISNENQFTTSGRAHEALNDVEAVIELARIFSQEKNIWDYALDFFNKTKDVLRINALKKEIRIGNKPFRLCLMVSASFGPKNNYLAPVIHIGESLPYKNQSLWLRLDREKVFEKNEESGIYDLFVIRKRPADELIVLPYLDRFMGKLTQTSQQSSQKNLEKIQSDPNLFFKTIQYHLEYKYPVIPDMDPDAALYQSGFFSSSEKKEINKFHGAENSDKPIVCESITSIRVKTLAKRILSRNFEDLFPIQSNPEYADHLRRLAFSFSGSNDPVDQKNQGDKENQIKGFRNDLKYHAGQGLAHIKEIEKQEKKLPRLTPVQKNILSSLKIYIENLST
ncbi:MAG: exodeoxyribonuclease [Desulfobacteraceae bacterium 4572_89]|nr:MAG: exodeoxyribonuclease [Desulfobacteraceae bacterium 4572_89]